MGKVDKNKNTERISPFKRVLSFKRLIIKIVVFIKMYFVKMSF